ncbi:MAG: PDZ domain-containing protein, partial [Planctomycetota bacterium]
LHSDYHKPSDDWEKVTYDEMADLAIGLVDFLERLAVAPRVGFAYVKPEAPKDPGKGRRGLGDGVWFGSLPDYGAMPDTGMQITGTSAGSPAEKAGLLPGDVILKVGKFGIGDIYDFMDCLAEFELGQTVTVVVLRDSKEVELTLTFFPRPGTE